MKTSDRPLKLSYAHLGFYSLGLLVLGFIVYLHGQFLITIPDPYIAPDSVSYLTPVIRYVEGHTFVSGPSRTLGYPLFLCLSLHLGQGFSTVLWIQHAFAIGTACLVGWMGWRFFKLPILAALGVSLLCALNPRSLVYSHEILTEVPYSLFFALTTAGILLTHNQNNYKVMIGLVLSLFIALAIRPTAYSLIAVAGAVLFWGYRHKNLQLKPLGIGLGLFVFLWGAACAYNWQTQNHWGLHQFGGLSLFGKTARYLNPHSIKDAAIRQALLPIYSQPEPHWNDPSWVLYDPQGPVRALSSIVPDAKDYDPLYKRLSLQAIAQRPMSFVKDQLQEFFDFLWQRSKHPGRLYPKEVTLAQGMEIYAKIVQEHPWTSKWVVFNPTIASRYFEAMGKTDLFPYVPTKPTWIFWPWVYALRWTALLSLVLLPFLIRESQVCRSAVVVVLIIFTHILITNLGADKSGRHAIPIEPFYILLTVAGVVHGIRQTCYNSRL